jgi:hypothetical protein
VVEIAAETVVVIGVAAAVVAADADVIELKVLRRAHFFATAGTSESKSDRVAMATKPSSFARLDSRGRLPHARASQGPSHRMVHVN